MMTWVTTFFFCLHQYSCQLWGYLDKKVTYIFRLSLFLFPAYLMLTWPNHYNLGIIGKIFSPIELEYKWCQFGKGWWHQKWNKLIMACYGYHRHQWVKVEAYNLKLNSCFGRLGGLVVSVLDSGASCPGSSPEQGHCVVSFGKTLNSLQPGV